MATTVLTRALHVNRGRSYHLLEDEVLGPFRAPRSGSLCGLPAADLRGVRFEVWDYDDPEASRLERATCTRCKRERDRRAAA